MALALWCITTSPLRRSIGGVRRFIASARAQKAVERELWRLKRVAADALVQEEIASIQVLQGAVFEVLAHARLAAGGSFTVRRLLPNGRGASKPMTFAASRNVHRFGT